MHTVTLLLGPIDLESAAQALIRIVAAIALGGAIGYDRKKAGGAAGPRTLAVLCLGTTLFIMAPLMYGMSEESVSRIGQGIGAMIGGLAIGTVITKHSEVIGFTTAVTTATTAGIGIAIGLGLIWLAMLATAATWIILRMSDASDGNGVQK